MRASRRVAKAVQRRTVDQLVGLTAGLLLSGLMQTPLEPASAMTSGIWEWPRFGLASWYSEQDPGITPWTASGERFSDGALTAAMWDLPFGSCVQVTNLWTLDKAMVRINDRGPAMRLVHQGRLIDLSAGAFAKLADLGEGLVPVQVELLDPHRCQMPTHQASRPLERQPASSEIDSVGTAG